MNEASRVLRRHLVVLIVLPVLCLLCAAALTARTTPMYRASSSVYFSLTNGDTATDLSQGSTYTQAQIESYSVLARSPRVLTAVADALPFDTTVPRLEGAVTTASDTGTVILQISATDASAERAAEIAGETGRQLRIAARQLSPKNSKGDPTVDVTTVGAAKVPTSPVTPNVKRNLGMGLIVGILLALAWVAIREKLDTRVHSAADIPTDVVPMLGTTDIVKGHDSHIAVVDAPMSTSAEQFRRLRTSVLFAHGDGDSIALTITSPGPSEGKSTVAVNLACAFAETGQRVLLIDGDIRRPSIARKLDIEGAVGLSTVLAGQAPFEEVVQSVDADGTLDVLAAGVVPPNPTQLLSTPKMRSLMASARSIYDVVVVDAPPILVVTDAALISAFTTGSVLVAREHQTRIEHVEDAIDELQNVEVSLLGTVLSRRAARRRHAEVYAHNPRKMPNPFAVGYRRRHGERRRPRQYTAVQKIGGMGKSR